MDKAFIVIIAFALIVLVAVVIIKYVYTIPSLVPGLSFIKTSTGSNINVDLRQVALPYMASGNLPDDCRSNGGTWYWQSDLVGCKNARTAYVKCYTAVTISAMTQCNGAGASWVCDTKNVYCTL